MLLHLQNLAHECVPVFTHQVQAPAPVSKPSLVGISAGIFWYRRLLLHLVLVTIYVADNCPQLYAYAANI